MALFHPDRKITLDELLTDPTVQDLLCLLSRAVVCLSTGQVHDLLRPGLPLSMRKEESDGHLRTVVHQLQTGGLLGTATVERLPPLTIDRTPVFGINWWYRPEVPAPDDIVGASIAATARGRYHTASSGAFGTHSLPDAFELGEYAEAARRRIPPLDRHRRARFFFATSKTAGVVKRSTGKTSTEPAHAGESAAMSLIESHRSVEGGPNASAEDIAGTQLTATFNLNQILLWEQYRALPPSARWAYRTAAGPPGPDAVLTLPGAGAVDLVFLRPVPPRKLGGWISVRASPGGSGALWQWWM